jgi:hypothetical protein
MLFLLILLGILLIVITTFVIIISKHKTPTQPQVPPTSTSIPTSSTSTSTAAPSVIVALGGNYNGVNQSNTIIYSRDNAVTWTGVDPTSRIFSNGGYGITYGNATWVACGYGTSNVLARSSDLITWVGVGAAGFVSVYYVFWTGFSFFVGGILSGNVPAMASSTDLINWTFHDVSTYISNTTCMAFNNNTSNPIYLIGGGDNGTQTDPSSILLSTDAINWFGVGGPNLFYECDCIHWAGTIWIAGGGAKTNNISMHTSPDGNNWTPVNNSTNMGACLSISHHNSTIVAGGIVRAGQNCMTVSTDSGNTWSSIDNNSLSIFPIGVSSITWTGTNFMASSYTNLSNQISTLAESVDGKQWTLLPPNNIIGNISMLFV